MSWLNLAVYVLLLVFLYFQASAGPTWTLTGNMAKARRDHTATLLTNGTVLIVGYSGWWFDPARTAELFQPTAGVFTLTGPPLFEHLQGSTATLMANGKVLVVGGSSLSTATEIYDPATGTFAQTGPLNVARSFHTATLLPDGRVLIAGGTQDSPQSPNSAELYNPAAGTFSLTGPLKVSRGGATAALLSDGRVLVCGGISSPPDLACLDSAELYNPVTSTFSLSGKMRTARCSLWWTTASVLSNGKVLIAGGSLLDSGDSAELFTPASGTFMATPNMSSPRVAGTATLLPGGQVLLTGGSSGPGPITSSTAEIYAPVSGSFAATASMNVPRQQHTATLLLDGRVLVTGGFNPANEELRSAELFTPGNRPPIAAVGPDQTVECTGAGASVTLDASASSDPDGDPLTFSWAGPFGTRTGAVIAVTLPLGFSTNAVTISDNHGGTDTARVLVIVRDNTPPTIKLSVSPSTIWPPNHQLVKVTAHIEAADACDPVPTVTLLSVTSNEPMDQLGAGMRLDDIAGAVPGTDSREIFLRAERSGKGTGRLYTITYAARDSSGNVTTSTAQVRVPHDRP